jgi:hypothetical protein
LSAVRIAGWNARLVRPKPRLVKQEFQMCLTDHQAGDLDLQRKS